MPPCSGSCFCGLVSFSRLRYIFPYTRAPGLPGVKKAMVALRKKKCEKHFPSGQNWCCTGLEFFFLLFVLRDGRQNFSFPFVGPPLAARAMALTRPPHPLPSPHTPSHPPLPPSFFLIVRKPGATSPTCGKGLLCTWPPAFGVRHFVYATLLYHQRLALRRKRWSRPSLGGQSPLR